MEFGGQDQTIQMTEPISLDLVKVAIIEFWPGVVFEIINNDLFAYRDQLSKQSWDQHGLTVNNADALLFITLDGSQVHDNQDMFESFQRTLLKGVE